MIDPLLPVGDGHTVLSDEDREGLIPTYITSRGELFDAEQRNISKAQLRRPPKLERFLDDKSLRDLHRVMFDDVWTWAGRYRTRETNFGIDPTGIPTAVRNLVADAKVWVEFSTFEPDELAVRFHHRLVFIHPFPNGNGRHGRMAADYLVRALGRHRFSWGADVLDGADEVRRNYHQALQKADRDDYADLVAFARA